MHRTLFLAVSIAAGALAAMPAGANSCQTEKLVCGSYMPVGGFCECTVNGLTQDGTVVSAPVPRGKTNASSGGCGAQPNAPGCR